jgi:hypothetical protein
MPNDLTAAVERLEKLVELRKAATQGEWVVGLEFAAIYRRDQKAQPLLRSPHYWSPSNEPSCALAADRDTKFCVAAANAATDDLPALLAAYEEQGREIERLRGLARELADYVESPSWDRRKGVPILNRPDVREIREQAPPPAVFHEK